MFVLFCVLSVLVNLCSTVEGGGGDLLERVDVAGTSLHNRDRSFLRDRGLGRDRGFPLYHLHRECHQSGANNQVHKTRCTRAGVLRFYRKGGEDLACERRPASSPVGAAFEATATSRRQLRGLKALHILKKKTIKVSRILKKETFKPSTIPHCEEEENNKKVPSKYDLYEAARFYSALKRKY